MFVIVQRFPLPSKIWRQIPLVCQKITPAILSIIKARGLTSSSRALRCNCRAHKPREEKGIFLLRNCPSLGDSKLRWRKKWCDKSAAWFCWSGCVCGVARCGGENGLRVTMWRIKTVEKRRLPPESLRPSHGGLKWIDQIEGEGMCQCKCLQSKWSRLLVHFGWAEGWKAVARGARTWRCFAAEGFNRSRRLDRGLKRNSY